MTSGPDSARRIQLMTTVDQGRVSWLGQFVEHYSRLGVDIFHITIHFEPDVAVQCRKDAVNEAQAAVEPYGAEIAATMVSMYDALTVRLHHDRLQAQVADGDWIVWADIDEFQVYPGELRELLQIADQAGASYFKGVLVDRVTRTGELAAFDPTRSIWSQYPRCASITGVVAEAPTQKVACSKARVRITPGNHYAVDDRSLLCHETSVQIHHFKWDGSVIRRLTRRIQPDWRRRCPWWVESDRLLRHIQEHGGRLGVKHCEW